jgi:hypothetical protein
MGMTPAPRRKTHKFRSIASNVVEYALETRSSIDASPETCRPLAKPRKWPRGTGFDAGRGLGRRRFKCARAVPSIRCRATGAPWRILRNPTEERRSSESETRGQDSSACSLDERCQTVPSVCSLREWCLLASDQSEAVIRNRILGRSEGCSPTGDAARGSNSSPGANARPETRAVRGRRLTRVERPGGREGESPSASGRRKGSRRQIVIGSLKPGGETTRGATRI